MYSCVFTELLLCHHATWAPDKATFGERWTSDCCLVPTHVSSYFGAKSLCDFLLDAKAFCSACRNQFTHYYKVKHQSPTSNGFLLAVSAALFLIVYAKYSLTSYDTVKRRKLAVFRKTRGLHKKLSPYILFKKFNILGYPANASTLLLTQSNIIWQFTALVGQVKAIQAHIPGRLHSIFSLLIWRLSQQDKIRDALKWKFVAEGE